MIFKKYDKILPASYLVWSESEKSSSFKEGFDLKIKSSVYNSSRNIPFRFYKPINTNIKVNYESN